MHDVGRTLLLAVLLLGALLAGTTVASGAGGADHSPGQAARDGHQGTSRKHKQRNRERRLLDRLFSGFSGEVRTLDGSRNNYRHPDWGQANTPYARVALPNYADGLGAMVSGPGARYVSNRVFNDLAQNFFSENRVTQWGFTWGQFLDHTFGLRQQGTESAPIAFDPKDPLEQFRNDLGVISFSRSAAAPGTGQTAPRQQTNTVSSYIDAWNVYGGTSARLDWLREGPADGNVANNGPRLLSTTGGYLPRADARGNVAAAPYADPIGGRLMANSAQAVIAGDVRANENVALTSTHTLFMREHNRIVNALPKYLSAEAKFQIARRVVGAEIQYVTYNEFLPVMGVQLDPYKGYDPSRNASLSNEFATVGYRAHSMIHGEIEPSAPAGTWSDEQLDAIEKQGIEVEHEDGRDVLVIPLNIAFANPSLVPEVGLGPILAGIGGESEYRNDEQIDNQLRSVLFQVPRPDAKDPSACLDGPSLPDCFTLVSDVGALDIERGRDHGMPYYNDLRRAYGLPPKRSFTDITREATEQFPPGGEISSSDPLDDPNILDFTQLLDRDGNPIDPGSPEASTSAVRGTRRSTLAARLKALYGDVDKVDAFVGMLAEPHVPGSELGRLQLAMWKQQFEALRDGDRFFYLDDPGLHTIKQKFGIDYRHTLADIIEMNTELEKGDLQPNVFEVSGEGGS